MRAEPEAEAIAGSCGFGWNYLAGVRRSEEGSEGFWDALQGLEGEGAAFQRDAMPKDLTCVCSHLTHLCTDHRAF